MKQAYTQIEKIPVGISSCLLGNEVRFDGQHKHDRFITGTLGRWFDFIPVCPEVECGLPIPRESMRLVGDPVQPRLVAPRSGTDHTERMRSWAARRLEQLAERPMAAFIFKAKSPSSGMRSIKVYNEAGNVVSWTGTGLFAAMFMERFPEIPVEDEGRLHDPGIRENFIETIFVLQRWRESMDVPVAGRLVDFHTRHKYTLMAHSQEKLRDLGRLVASIGTADLKEIAEEYSRLLLQTLRLKKTVKKEHNVLLHIMGYFKKLIMPEEKQELLELLDQYYRETVPLIVPVTMLRHYARKYRVSYLEGQWYLNPYPMELKLQNHV